MALLARLRRRHRPEPVALDPDDPDLVLIVEAFEAFRADSEVLAVAVQRGVDLSQPVLMRHHLIALPDEAALTRAGELLGQDGYVLRPGPATAPPRAVLACRTQLLTALSASQERSRMAGLAQRLGGDVLGWDALVPGSAGASPVRSRA